MDLSILMPVHNCVDLTRQCFESMWPTLPSDRTVEILVYDDLSVDQTPAYLQSLSDRIQLIRGTQRGSFAANINRLALRSSGRWLCIVNNDLILRPHWLDAMLQLASVQSDVGVVGNVHLFPGGRKVSHAGVVFDEEGLPRHLYEGMPADLGQAYQTRSLQCVSAACWLVERDLFRRMGGFDTGYRNGHEDLDFCLRLSELGKHAWVCGESVVEHYGSSTAGRFDHIDENHRLFIARWSDHYVLDQQQITRADGVHWPERSPAYRLLRAIWRQPWVKAVIKPILRQPGMLRARQKLMQQL